MKKLFLCLLLSLVAPCARLEAQVTTSSINGTVLDAVSKETLAGTSIVAKHMPTGTVYGAASNAKGNFHIQGLRPGGPYTITISYIGYKTATLENVMLSLGEAETLNIRLKEDSQVLDNVIVTAKRSYDNNASRTGAGASFSRRSIEATPTVSRSLFDIAKLTPQASVSSNGAISFAGANNRYNSFQIDGAVSNDVFGLSGSGTNGGQTGAQPISLEAIDAIQVVIAPFDVRQSGFTGGGINVVTKGGTNEFHGSLYDFYNNQNFYGSTPGRGVKNRQKLDKQYNNTAGFTLGGPIIKDKLFFFVNGEWQKSSYPSRYLVGDGSEVSEETASSILEHVKKLSGGYDGGGYGSLDVTTESKKALARLDWNINAKHRLTLRYSYLDAARLRYSPSARTLVFRDQAFYQKNKTHTIVGELNSRFSNSVSNELRFSYNRIRDHRQTVGQPFPYIEIRDGNSNIRLGTDNSSMANSLDQDIFSLTNNLTFSLGNHNLTLGTHNELFRIKNLFIQNRYGRYVFNSLSDFLSQGTANPANPATYDYGYAREEITGTPLYAPEFKAAQLGFYVQDEWKVSNLLQLSYGLRVDVPIFFDKPRANDAFNQSEMATSYGITNSTMPSSTPLIAPRIGFRYHLDETRKHLIRGGVGIFTGRIPFVWVYNGFSNTGIEFSRTYLSSRDMNNAKADGFAFSVNPSKQYSSKTIPSSEVNMIAKDFRFPQTLRASLAFETTLPGGIKATIEGVFNKNFYNISYNNLNFRPTGKYLDHGSIQRPLYEKISRSYTNLLVLENTNKGYSYNFTASLSKNFAFGLNASLAYTYGKSMAPFDGTSSVASSNWRYNYNFHGPNDAELALTAFDVRHRIVGSLNYKVKYGKHFATTVGLIYNGQSGGRFTMTYANDVNGDGERSNDLIYIPTKSELAAMTFVDKGNVTAAESKQNFEDFISSNPEIAQYRGNYIPRNGLVAPFVHRFDLHLAQDFYIKVGKRTHTIQLNADVVNVGNLINRAWGIERSVNYSVAPLQYKAASSNNPAEYHFTSFRDGKMWSLRDIDSRWHAQVGIKYIF